MSATEDDPDARQSIGVSAEDALKLAARLFSARAEVTGDEHDAVMSALVQHLAKASQWERTEELATEYTEALTRLYRQALKWLTPKGLELLVADEPPTGRARTATMRALVEVAKIWRAKLRAVRDGAELEDAVRRVANVLADAAALSLAPAGTDFQAAESRLAQRLHKKHDADAETIARWALEACGMPVKKSHPVLKRARAQTTARKGKK